MKKINVLAILISLLFWNCEKPIEKSSISVHIENLKSETVYVRFASFGEKFESEPISITLKNGKFTLDTLISKPKEVLIQPSEMLKKLSNGELFPIPSKLIRFFIYPNGDVHIKGNMEDYKVDYAANGNKLSTQYSKYRNQYISYFELSSKLMYEVENLYSQNASDSIITISSDQLTNVLKTNRQIPTEYISKNFDKEISSYLLYSQPKDTVKKYYSRLNDNVQDSDYGKLINSKIDKWNQVTVNSKAPDFEYETYKNGTLKLSEQNKKYIILDFWGSWCGPCIMEMPKMKEFYNKNKTEIEIIGIAARDNKENWIKSIKENELEWKQILNNKEKDDLVKKYGVTGFPTKIIINSSGKIEGIYLGAKDDFFLKMQELLN